MRIRPTALCFLATALMASAAIVDRAAITVGNQVITESEIVRRIRLQAFQSGMLPDFSDKSRRETAQRLIDLKLVQREMDLGRYERTTPERPLAMVDAFAAEHFRSSSEALRLALESVNLTVADLQTEFAEQIDLLSFTSLRFKPAVEVKDQEIEDYYRVHFPPKEGQIRSALADVRASIEDILATQRADLALDAWLKDLRSRTRIVYLEKELQ